ncbi:hypothetical protein ABTL49_19375, partial [Acinetobacter baumannii]
KARAGEDRTAQAYASAILLLVLTGCRVGEILSLEWSDLKGLRLHLRDSKTGPRTVWLGDEARDLIVALPRCGKNASIFWNWRYRRP